MALSGVITRMPLVCMSIVASAFQYGWAPTLMPVTTTLISPPSWVNSMIRRRARATQSMFSVPLSIEIRAPADRANHSTGTPISCGQVEGGDHPRALGLGDGAERLGRVAEQDDAAHALGEALGRRAGHADDDPGRVLSGGPVHRDQTGSRLRSAVE